VSSIRLRGEAIEKRYGRVAALRGVDFEIAPGDSLSILGANGAGKSSLLRILSGLSRPSGGRFDARPIEGGAASGPGAGARGDSAEVAGAASKPLSREALRGVVGYVGHATLLYGELTARENLTFAARLHGLRPSAERIDRLLEDFSLLEVAERRAGRFSRGMAQRLSIARAVVHDPALLLLDEPFTGLDELSAERLSARLADQRASGRTLVLVTHDPRRAVELTDRAIVLHRGRVRATPARAAGDSRFDVEGLRDRLAALARETADATNGVAA
jgi:ABC-type multidrug transport system ATPase subunit